MQMHFQTYYEPIVKKESKKNFNLLLTAPKLLSQKLINDSKQM